MTLQASDFSQLDISKVQQNQQQLCERLQEFDPTVETKRGPLGDYLGYYGAVLETDTQNNIDLYRQSSSLAAITANPDLADPALVDNVLSNFLLTRKAGTNAVGDVTIVVSQLAVVTIPTGAVFQAAGQLFVTTTSYTARTSSDNVQSSTDRVLTPLAGGNYAFVISVTAQSAGEASNISKDTLVVPSAPPLAFVKAYAASDFTGGTAAATNAQLIAQLGTGMAAKALSGRTNMDAALLAQEKFANVLATSIIGAGDEEMRRDAHTIFPISYGGKIDWYIRTQPLPQKVGLTKTAVLIKILPDNTGIWQFALSRDEVPGFYDVPRIAPRNSSSVGSYTIVNDTRSIDLSPTADGVAVPDIISFLEGAYSRYQAGVIQFHDTDTNCQHLTLHVSTATYSVTVRGMPLLAEIQSYVGGREVRNAAGDVLVKAPIPCLLKLSFDVWKLPGTPDPDVGGIQAALADAVNNYGFSGQLPASLINATTHQFLAAGMFLNSLDMFGKILLPDGQASYLRSGTLLTVPHLPDVGTTSRTVVFYLDPADIAITVRTITLPQV